jgi:hypothetical protein
MAPIALHLLTVACLFHLCFLIWELCFALCN